MNSRLNSTVGSVLDTNIWTQLSETYDLIETNKLRARGESLRSKIQCLIFHPWDIVIIGTYIWVLIRKYLQKMGELLVMHCCHYTIMYLYWPKISKGNLKNLRFISLNARERSIMWWLFIKALRFVIISNGTPKIHLCE